MKHWIWAIIENNEWDILVVEEKETREDYSKFKWDISIPFWKVWDNIKNESFVDALYREVLEETWLNLTEHKYFPCELWDWYLENTEWKILFKAKIFHIKLNWVLKKYEEKILRNEVKNAYFISKKDFEIKIEKWWIRAWADVFYEAFLKIKDDINFFQDHYLQLVVWPWSKYNLKHEWK